MSRPFGQGVAKRQWHTLYWCPLAWEGFAATERCCLLWSPRPGAIYIEFMWWCTLYSTVNKGKRYEDYLFRHQAWDEEVNKSQIKKICRKHRNRKTQEFWLQPCNKQMRCIYSQLGFCDIMLQLDLTWSFISSTTLCNGARLTLNPCKNNNRLLIF